MTPTVHIEPVYVDLATAAMITTLAESTIQAMVTREEFPAPRELSGAARRVSLRRNPGMGTELPAFHNAAACQYRRLETASQSARQRRRLAVRWDQLFRVFGQALKPNSASLS